MTCLCMNPCENAIHYITECWLYGEERQALFNQVEKFIPNIRKLTKQRQFEIFVYGYDIDNNELSMIKINTQILIFTQNFILKTKRF